MAHVQAFPTPSTFAHVLGCDQSYMGEPVGIHRESEGYLDSLYRDALGFYTSTGWELKTLPNTDYCTFVKKGTQTLFIGLTRAGAKSKAVLIQEQPL